MIRSAVVAMTSLVVLCGFAPASDPAGVAYERGYRECDQSHLDVCQNTNQLIWGPINTGGHRKEAFDRNLKLFLAGAPKVHFLKFSWSAAQVALESLTGPGGPPVRLKDDAWFFDGFTPHDAPECGAIVFDADGTIVLVATLRSGEGPKERADDALNVHGFTIYVHQPEPDQAVVQYVQNWARGVVKGLYNYPGLPKSRFGNTRILTSDERHQWRERQIDDWKAKRPGW